MPTASNTASADWATTTEQALLDRMLDLAPELGWSWTALARAARDEGLSAADAELLLPHGPADLAALLSRRHDARAAEILAETDPRTLKIRERILRAAEARLEAAAEDLAGARRCGAFLTLAPHAPLGLRLAWESADRIWRWAGDTATDENHYSKRALLAGILIIALPLRLESGRETAQRFLFNRVDQVMAFEKWKSGLPKPSDLATRAVELLGRLRYGA
jgi:ubiquinone biosynthesis protein COQ9